MKTNSWRLIIYLEEISQTQLIVKLIQSTMGCLGWFSIRVVRLSAQTQPMVKFLYW
jgi:hypothetical protein